MSWSGVGLCRLRVYRVVDGHFTRMTITTEFSSTDTPAEHLNLVESNAASGGQFSWVTK